MSFWVLAARPGGHVTHPFPPFSLWWSRSTYWIKSSSHVRSASPRPSQCQRNHKNHKNQMLLWFLWFSSWHQKQKSNTFGLLWFSYSCKDSEGVVIMFGRLPRTIHCAWKMIKTTVCHLLCVWRCVVFFLSTIQRNTQSSKLLRCNVFAHSSLCYVVLCFLCAQYSVTLKGGDNQNAT